METKMKESNDDMRLLDGKTCRDCGSFKTCSGLFNCKPGNKSCDWSPSRFNSRVETKTIIEKDQKFETIITMQINAGLTGAVGKPILFKNIKIGQIIGYLPSSGMAEAVIYTNDCVPKGIILDADEFGAINKFHKTNGRANYI